MATGFVYISGLYIQAQPCMLILDSSSNEAYLCWTGLYSFLLLLVSHCAEVFCYIQPFPLLSVSTVTRAFGSSSFVDDRDNGLAYVLDGVLKDPLKGRPHQRSGVGLRKFLARATLPGLSLVLLTSY